MTHCTECGKEAQLFAVSYSLKTEGYEESRTICVECMLEGIAKAKNFINDAEKRGDSIKDMSAYVFGIHDFRGKVND